MRAEFGDRARFHFFRLRGGVLARRGGEGGEGAVASTRDRCFVFESRDVSMPLECIYVYFLVPILRAKRFSRKF